MDSDHKATLVIGDNDYPFAIPLERVKGMWSFDTQGAAKKSSIAASATTNCAGVPTCLAYVDAQNEYAERIAEPAPGSMRGASSASGKKDGLYWPSARASLKVRSANYSPRRRIKVPLRRRPHSLSRLLLQDPDGAGARRNWRTARLHRQRQNDRRFCAGCLSGRVPQFGRDDVHRQPSRGGISKGPRPRLRRR